jgi:hypothetical protein
VSVETNTLGEASHPAFQTFADLLDPPENPYVRDPVGWVTSTLGEFWWSGQRRMAQSVVGNRYSAFKASHDVSKSHTMSRLALWWIRVHPPGEAFVDVSDDTLIQPKWIEAAQKRSLERTRRPLIAADIARFGEDETVIMRREGGWVRTYRASQGRHDGNGWPHCQGDARY